MLVSQTWHGIRMEPLHLDVNPGLPAFLKARARPVREALYKDAKAEFDRMKTYFYVLLEAVRPRTKEQHSQEMAENFARTFYGPLIDSLSSMLHLLAHDSSNVSNNASKMPVPGMCTRESPGHMIWLSLVHMPGTGIFDALLDTFEESGVRRSYRSMRGP